MTIPFISPSDDSGRWEPPNMKTMLQIHGNPLVACVCGRHVNADMMRQQGDGFSCDACNETLFRTGQITREEFAVAQGAPAAVVDKARQIDAALST